MFSWPVPKLPVSYTRTKFALRANDRLTLAEDRTGLLNLPNVWTVKYICCLCHLHRSPSSLSETDGPRKNLYTFSTRQTLLSPGFALKFVPIGPRLGTIIGVIMKTAISRDQNLISLVHDNKRKIAHTSNHHSSIEHPSDPVVTVFIARNATESMVIALKLLRVVAVRETTIVSGPLELDIKFAQTQWEFKQLLWIDHSCKHKYECDFCGKYPHKARLCIRHAYSYADPIGFVCRLETGKMSKYLI